MAELAYSYAALIKSEKQEDGTLKVYGKATDDSVDIDQQICDDAWLQKAMPDWFVSGGNVREQHSNIAAGVATDYEAKADGHYITALVVDPVSVKKVEAGVLKGFSIGIRGPRVVRDTKAAGGRIVDGQIIEISLVDRPANPNAKLMLAKAADGGVLEAVKQLSIPSPADLVKYSEDQERDASGRFGSGDGSSAGSSDSTGNSADTPNAIANATSEGISDIRDSLDQIDQEAMDTNGLDDDDVRILSDVRGSLDEADDAVSDASSTTDPEMALEHLENAGAHLEDAANRLSWASNRDIAGQRKEVEKLMDKLDSKISAAYDALENADKAAAVSARIVSRKSNVGRVVKSDEPTATLETPNEGATMPEETTETVATEEVVAEPVVEETATEEVVADEAVEIVDAAKSLLTTLNKFDQATYDRAVEAIADLIVVEANEMKAGHDERDSIKELLRASKHLTRWYEGEVEEGEVLAALPTEEDIYMAADAKAEECDCAGGEDCECGEDKMCKCNMAAEKSATLNVTVDEDQISVIVNKAVASAKAAVTDEIDALKTALEAESAKAIQLEQDLVTAKKAAVAGGPKRAVVTKSVADTNALLTKASEYRQKAAATLDKTLAEGYRELADDLETKASKGN